MNRDMMQGAHLKDVPLAGFDSSDAKHSRARSSIKQLCGLQSVSQSVMSFPRCLALIMCSNQPMASKHHKPTCDRSCGGSVVHSASITVLYSAASARPPAAVTSCSTCMHVPTHAETQSWGTSTTTSTGPTSGTYSSTCTHVPGHAEPQDWGLTEENFK